MSHRESVVSPHSKYKEDLLNKLKELKYIKDYSVAGEIIKEISVDLLYEDDISAVTGIEIISKPGRRNYQSYKNLKPVVNNFGCSILSTSKGILSNKEAKKAKIGGELLFNIW